MYNGGVVNYTRPLSERLSSMGHEIIYLYTETNLNKSSVGKTRIIRSDLPCSYSAYVLETNKSLLRNYDRPEVDFGNWMDLAFEEFIKKIQPDVMHINEIFGFSSSIIGIAKRNNIKVVNTVHEYWFLCMHRVMVDFNRKICNGPSDIEKCSHCVSKKLHGFNRQRILSRQLANKYAPGLLTFAQKRRFKAGNPEVSIDLSFGSEVPKEVDAVLSYQLSKRLSKNIEALNLCDINIGVSLDVRKKLIQYGVEESKVLVQHIGSIVAERNIRHNKAADPNRIVFGFIGGVGYYKGVHLLAEAFELLPKNLKQRCSVEIYGRGDQAYIDTIKGLLSDSYSKKNFTFHGGFTAVDLPNITNRIDIAILPSLCADTAPQTIFESYAAGLPVIGPMIGGFPDFVKHADNGLLFDAGNAKSLSDQMLMVLNNPALIASMRSNLPELKTLDVNAEELVSLYESL